MLDLQIATNTLKRPRLLVQAARFGLENYRREKDLVRLLELSRTPKTGEAIKLLLSAEKDENTQRKGKGVYYSYTRHIELLTAIMAETALLDQISRSQTPT